MLEILATIAAAFIVCGLLSGAIGAIFQGSVGDWVVKVATPKRPIV